MIYLLLFLAFFRAGLFAVGGGLATIPFLKQISIEYNWFSLEQLMDMIAVSESTPGSIGINMSTYAGFNTAGIFGGIIATIGLVFPSVVVIIFVSRALEKFRDSSIVKNMFYGLRPASAGLIAGAVFDVFIKSLFYTRGNDITAVTGINIKAVVLFVTIIVIITKKPKIHPIIFIIASAILGVLVKI